ncbi:LysR family transcriptional regulator [Candidatus Enterococcus ferrettii]|uniref:HTH lysR-type domain-containing protein n=1 Tax=Candidatus Enterococcus ferrettii TaxID=2815324 RepID=A0ABV0ES71_9ENTE|nr:LysR family transcriptional regulator [Enterococcus sp. 665A]MBO1340544.1 LysR family transcriptional regulator [Enterococcus sp. 665A]
MNIRQLEMFMVVAEVENMTEAAERTFISQSAVSQTIQELEREIGIRLFDRPGRSIQLNPAGKSFYQRVKHFLQEYQELEDFAVYLEKQAPMKLGANLTIANFWLPELIPSFLQHGYQVTIQADSAEHILTALRNQDLDLALLEGSVAEKGLVVEPFDQYELVVVMGIEHPLARQETVSVKDFLQYPLFLREQGSAIRKTLDSWLLLQQKQAVPMMTSINSPALLAMTATGTGITLLVEQSIYHDQVCCLPFEGQRLYNQIQLVYQPEHLFTETMRAFRKSIFSQGEKING